jgi:hypothetical protein
VVPVTGHHQDKIIGITDEFPMCPFRGVRHGLPSATRRRAGA